ncbi:hypothetical protein [Zhihengliuella sp.]|uniref:hypothetical protein n=1 Tax=Zhihengliuella sp. TaxID=1954483 RepID=UPI00281121D3|nr:hypothetical protein [Zhihengliuella sp.]
MMALAAADPSLMDAPTGDAAREVGPGFVGFVATALMVVAAIFLIRDMVRRIRRVRYTAETEDRQRELVERGKQYQTEDDDAPQGDAERTVDDAGPTRAEQRFDDEGGADGHDSRP